MKAVVMAGGEGTRLRPLTISRPKPMLPVVGRPVMEHILHLLRQHGITEVMVTVRYLATQIEEYFGDGRDFDMQITYSVEQEPLGTAGSVRRCAMGLHETLLVISGDALTDIDLGKVIAAHHRKGAWVTLALARVSNPLEFGVVITDVQGNITRFLEKPAWSQVFSDTINTGIYVLEPEALAEIPQNQTFDFSKDLFPRLLSMGSPMHGEEVSGYWCDIGTIDQFVQANHDALTGRVSLQLAGRRLPQDIWVGPGTIIDPSAQLRGPLWIGDNTTIKEDVIIEGPGVIGASCVLDRNSTVQRSVLLGNTYVGPGAMARAAVLGRGVRIGAGSAVLDGAVVADGCRLQADAQVQTDVKIWPNKVIEAGAVVNQSIIWGTHWRQTLFGATGVAGAANVDVTPEVAVRLGAAYGSTLQRGDGVVVSRDGHPASTMMKRALVAGLASTGVRVFNLDTVPLPVTRYAAGALGARGGIYAQMQTTEPGAMELRFLDSRGIDVDTGTERKIENLYFREDARRAAAEDVGMVSYPAKVLEIYLTGYLNKLRRTRSTSNKRVVVACPAEGSGAQILTQVLSELSCEPILVRASTAPEPIGQTVRALHADFGVQVDTPGERLLIVDDNGMPLSGQHALVLFSALAARHGQGEEIAVPITATSLIEEVCGSTVRVRRIGAGVRAMMHAASAGGLVLAGDGEGGFAFPFFHPGVDALFSVGLLVQWLSEEEHPLSRILAELPQPRVTHETVPCPWQAKGHLMRRLVESTMDKQVTLLDGIKVRQGGEWVAVLPDAHRPTVHLLAESTDGGGSHLLDEYRAIVQEIVASAEVAAEGN